MNKNISKTPAVGALAVLDFTITELVDACMGSVADSLADVRADFAKLIEADRDYDKAKAEYESAASRLEAWPALESAKARRAAALAAVGGAK